MVHLHNIRRAMNVRSDWLHILVTTFASEEVGRSFIGSSELNGRELDFLSLAHWAGLSGCGLVLSVAKLDGLDCRALGSKDGWEGRSLCLGCESFGHGIFSGLAFVPSIGLK